MIVNDEAMRHFFYFRIIVKVIGCLTLFCLSTLSLSAQKVNRHDKKGTQRKAAEPLSNVIVIVGDDHAAYALGCYGNEIVETPNLDRFASHASRFERAYCNSPVCTPSRQSFLTGKMPHATGVTLLPTALSDSVYTIPEHLRSKGFKTAAIGKTHFQSDLDHGFDYVIRQDDPSPMAPAYKAYLDSVDEVLPDGMTLRKKHHPFKEPARFFWNADGLPAPHYDANEAGTFFANKANEFIEQHRDERFCLWVGFLEPHAPFTFPIEYAGRIDPETIVLPQGTDADDRWVPLIFRSLTDEDKRGIIRSYYTSVEYLDKNVGLILDKVESLGLTRKTLIIYLGDNGYLLNHHKRFEKHTMWEEGVRVPLIIQAGGLAENGERAQPSVITSLTELVDLAPTIYEALGIEAPEGLHGKSLWPLLTGKSRFNKDIVFSEYTVDNRAMVRTERFKYVYTNGKADLGLGYTTGHPPSGIRYELYDMKNDPHETTNLAYQARYQKIVKKLRQRLLDQFRRTHPLRGVVLRDLPIDEQLAMFCEPIENRGAREK